MADPVSNASRRLLRQRVASRRKELEKLIATATESINDLRTGIFVSSGIRDAEGVKNINELIDGLRAQVKGYETELAELESES